MKLKKLVFIPVLTLSFLVCCTSKSIFSLKTKTTYTVTFDSKGGSYIPEAQTIISGGKVNEPNKPTKDDFTFGGWYTDEEAIEYKYDFSRPVVTNLTLYAKWDKIDNLVTVTFDAGDGTYFNGEHKFPIKVEKNSELNLCLNIMSSYEPILANNTFAYYSYKDTNKSIGYNDIVTDNITITANYFPTAKVPYNDLNDISWDAIKGVAITKKDISEVFNIGATKTITLSNKVSHTIRILDFHKDSLHYDESTTSLSAKSAGITFEFFTVISKSNKEADTSVWDSSGNNKFSKSTLNTLLNGSVFNQLPNDLKPLVEKVNKKVGETESSTSTTYTAKTYSPYLFPLAHNEMCDDDDGVTSGEGSKYQLYKNGASRVKQDSKGNSVSYWLRSPYTKTVYMSGVTNVWAVTEGGVVSENFTFKYDELKSFAPAFCI